MKDVDMHRIFVSFVRNLVAQIGFRDEQRRPSQTSTPCPRIMEKEHATSKRRKMTISEMSEPNILSEKSEN